MKKSEIDWAMVFGLLIVLLIITGFAIPMSREVKLATLYYNAYHRADYYIFLDGLFVLDGKEVTNASEYLALYVDTVGTRTAGIHIKLGILAFGMNFFKFNSSLILDYVEISLYDDGLKIMQERFTSDMEFIIDENYSFNYDSFSAIIKIHAIPESIIDNSQIN